MKGGQLEKKLKMNRQKRGNKSYLRPKNIKNNLEKLKKRVGRKDQTGKIKSLNNKSRQ